MKLISGACAAAFACVLATAGGAWGQGPVETVLHSFESFPNGESPCGAPVLDPAGNAFGTTFSGGASNAGAIYELKYTAMYEFLVLYSFRGGVDGGGPNAGLIRDPAGDFFGTTVSGGAANAGVIFEVTSAGQETVLFDFPGGAGGAKPYAGVAVDRAGNLYGTTYYGGANNFGIVYKLSRNGQQTVLYNFTGGADGANPYTGVVLDAAGNMYGTTSAGGANLAGSVYKLSPAGQLTVLYSFPQGGGAPGAGLTFDAKGNLYGLSANTIFKISASGQFTHVATLPPAAVGGAPSAAVTFDSAGNLYGTTGAVVGPNGTSAPFGALFELDRAGQLSVLYHFPGRQNPGKNAVSCPIATSNSGVFVDSNFNIFGVSQNAGNGGALYERTESAVLESVLLAGAPGGSHPRGGVIRGPNGYLFGTTWDGGAENTGVIYELAGESEIVQLQGYGSFGPSLAIDPPAQDYYLLATAGQSNPNQIWKLGAPGYSSVLYTFTGGTDGEVSPGGVTIDAAGNIYGTSTGGHSTGTIFKLDKSGQFTVLYSTVGDTFLGNVGSQVTPDTAGNLYGVTTAAYPDSNAVYRLTVGAPEPDRLYIFTGGLDGSGPNVGLAIDSQGSVYGTTAAGGVANAGVVYKLDSARNYTVLYSFPGGVDGASPRAGVTLDSSGNIYGTAALGGDMSCIAFGGPPALGCGVVFRIDPAGNYSVLHRFTGGNDGAYPDSVLVVDSRGVLGSTTYGGKADAGVVYKIAP